MYSSCRRAIYYPYCRSLEVLDINLWILLLPECMPLKSTLTFIDISHALNVKLCTILKGYSENFKRNLMASHIIWHWSAYLAIMTNKPGNSWEGSEGSWEDIWEYCSLLHRIRKWPECQMGVNTSSTVSVSKNTNNEAFCQWVEAIMYFSRL